MHESGLVESLTEFWNSKDLRVRLQQFCQISNLVYPPLKGKINLDFWLLLLACRQWFVFRKKAVDSLAGSNQNVCHLIEDPLVENPVPDFMTYTETVVDSYKQIVFTSGFYIALIAVFLAGTLRPTLFSFGNIIASFTFLWEGSDMFLRPANIILRRWNYLIAYNVIVLVVRSASQIFECILIYEANVEINCKISRLFTIGCVDSYGMMEDIPGISTESSCTVLKTALGLGWDCFSFFCLICQQRIFKSYHFIHIVNNAKAKTILADCGAILIEEQRREKKTAIDVERSALEANIKLKMQRLREIEEISKDGYYHFDRVDIPLMPDKVEEESDYESFDPMPLPEYFGLFYSSGMETVLEITALRKERKRNLRQKVYEI
ncbi:unnamed protein product [Ceutorhynchus assimilis]|uniref:Piezo TM25-28 domain-containing protein n=1 Tax=Ceutorhynchus assimilis TaxID=467358 RepID=A0A9N9MID0_9CUCU|nr:unnamed protein product [Ceutorhynchus assimilis]